MISQVFTSERIPHKIIRNVGMRLQNFRQPCPRPKNLKEYRFEGETNYTPARDPHMCRAKSFLQKVDPRVGAAFI
jgi:hypothetical protein